MMKFLKFCMKKKSEKLCFKVSAYRLVNRKVMFFKGGLKVSIQFEVLLVRSSMHGHIPSDSGCSERAPFMIGSILSVSL